MTETVVTAGSCESMTLTKADLPHVPSREEVIDRVETAILEACDYALPPFLAEKCARAALKAIGFVVE